MSFSFFIKDDKQSLEKSNAKKIRRKEKESDYITHFVRRLLKKTSIPASFGSTIGGSVTVEAVIIIPLFLYASVCLIWMLELRAIQLTVRCALQAAATELSVELAEVPVLLPNVLREKVEARIGDDRLKRSLIVDGIHCEKSYLWGSTGIMELTAEYEAKLPFPEFAIPNLVYQEEMRVKVWNGYRKGGMTEGKRDTVVYVTETGVVYHKRYDCNYLDLSIRKVGIAELNEIRNQEGGRYHICERCGSHAGNEVYITNYGNRYHASAGCSGLKRKVYAVPLSEVKGKGACSKCGK